jgi:hypothetical protein
MLNDLIIIFSSRTKGNSEIDEVGKYYSAEREEHLHNNFENFKNMTVWEVDRKRQEIVVFFACPKWTMIVLSIPECKVLFEVSLRDISMSEESHLRMQLLNGNGFVAFEKDDRGNEDEDEDDRIIFTFCLKGKDTKVGQ